MVKKQHTKYCLFFIHLNTLGPLWDPGDVFRMFFDGFFGLLGSKKPIFTPVPKNFYFCTYVWSFNGGLYFVWKSKLGLMTDNDLVSSFSTPGMGLNHVLMCFSESRDDFRWNMYFFKIFSTFIVFDGNLRETPKMTQNYT